MSNSPFLFSLDLGSGDEKVKKMDCRKFLTPGYTTSGHVELFTVRSYKYLHHSDSRLDGRNITWLCICVCVLSGQCRARNVVGGSDTRLGRTERTRRWFLCAGMEPKRPTRDFLLLFSLYYIWPSVHISLFLAINQLLFITFHTG